MASLQERGRGLPRDASVGRRQAEIDAIHGEAGGFDAQSLDDGCYREGVAFDICVSVNVLRSWILLTTPV